LIFEAGDTKSKGFRQMILRLKYYRFCLRVITYLLPFLAFELGWETWTHIWNSLGRLT